MTNQLPPKESIVQNSQPGFYYDLIERRAIELDQAVVSSPFPFVYFSDNENSVFLYQIPMYTFQARFLNELSSVQKTGYFAFNSFDRQMQFHQVHLKGITDPAEKLFKTMSAKMLLRSGFIFAGQVYQITEESVYVLSLEDMQTNPMPVPIKIPLSQFLVCSKDAIGKSSGFDIIAFHFPLCCSKPYRLAASDGPRSGCYFSGHYFGAVLSHSN